MLRLIMVLFTPLWLAGCVSIDTVVTSKPMSFSCGGALEGSEYVWDYEQPGFTRIQRDASALGQVSLSNGRDQNENSPNFAGDPLFEALIVRRGYREDYPPSVLLLSGGGQWGAFGAGYLNSLKTSEQEWSAVTGISTGALQALFVGAGEFEQLEEAYKIEERNPATKNNFFGFIRKGSEYDLSNLRMIVRDALDPSPTAEGPKLLEKLRHRDGPQVLIGLVEAGAGKLKVFDVTKYVGDKLPRDLNDTAGVNAVIDCVTGVALGSSSIPLRLTPIKIDGRTYLDGGVRSSVFAEGTAARLKAALAESEDNDTKCLGDNEQPDQPCAPRVDVIRNGPTVVPEGSRIDGATSPYRVDANPSVYRTSLRGYATLVNQNELSSIVLLREKYPDARFRVATADGYNRSPADCGERNPNLYFDPLFMRCLIKWGREKQTNGYKGHSGWIELKHEP